MFKAMGGGESDREDEEHAKQAAQSDVFGMLAIVAIIEVGTFRQ
jgi:hypothetical protein